jgi:hypothetical protein
MAGVPIAVLWWAWRPTSRGTVTHHDLYQRLTHGVFVQEPARPLGGEAVALHSSRGCAHVLAATRDGPEAVVEGLGRTLRHSAT